MNETIAAIATAPHGATRGVIRVSGPEVIHCVRPWFTSREDWAQATRATVYEGSFLIQPPRCVPGRLYLWPSDRSYTRQPLAEFHTVGSLPLLERLLSNLAASGARPAEPGEFTLRAFLSGRLDLTQAEAVLGVIDAENGKQFRVAVEQLAGGLSQRLQVLRDDLLNLSADLEAGMDFVEEDIDFVSAVEVLRRVETAEQGVEQMLSRMDNRATAAQLPKVALVGSPNVGKSSLINALAAEKVAIVASQPGTTRDYVCRVASFGGVSCELVDTAGRDASAQAQPDIQAQTLTDRLAAQADVRLICLDASRPMAAVDADWLSTFRPDRDLVVLTKSDLPRQLQISIPHLHTSSRTGAGMDELQRYIRAKVGRDTHYHSETIASTSARCRDSLHSCLDHLVVAARLTREQLGEELVAAEVRLALHELGRVAGTVYTDDILDRLFSRFCIGK